MCSHSACIAGGLAVDKLCSDVWEARRTASVIALDEGLECQGSAILADPVGLDHASK